MRRPPLLALVLAFAVACGGGTAASPEETRGNDDTAQAAPDSRLRYCGAEQIGQDGRMNRHMRECFWQAYQAGEPVEFTTTRLTEEGRPISETFTYAGTGRIQVYVDSKDSFGLEGMFRYECSGAAPDARRTVTFTGCTEWAPEGGPAVPQPERP